jgi:hypothetical protein
MKEKLEKLDHEVIQYLVINAVTKEEMISLLLSMDDDRKEEILDNI